MTIQDIYGAPSNVERQAIFAAAQELAINPPENLGQWNSHAYYRIRRMGELSESELRRARHHGLPGGDERILVTTNLNDAPMALLADGEAAEQLHERWTAFRDWPRRRYPVPPSRGEFAGAAYLAYDNELRLLGYAGGEGPEDLGNPPTIEEVQEHFRIEASVGPKGLIGFTDGAGGDRLFTWPCRTEWYSSPDIAPLPPKGWELGDTWYSRFHRTGLPGWTRSMTGPARPRG